MRIAVEHVLRAHAFMRTEAPPETWQPEADDESFFRVLGEIIAAGLARRNELADLTPNNKGVEVVHSIAGHDGFLTEHEAIGEIIAAALG